MINYMPIEIKQVDCKKCNFNYCPCCESKCPKCGEIDIPEDAETMLILQEIRKSLNKE